MFSLVIMAWSALASAFGPLLIYLALGGKPSQRRMLLAIFVGLGIALIWRWLGWHTTIYEGMPGILSGLLLLYGPDLLQTIGAQRKADSTLPPLFHEHFSQLLKNTHK